jgi:hypothetical protein
VVVGAIYELQDPEFDLTKARTFHAAIKSCVDEHPFLSAQVVDGDINYPKPTYWRGSKLNIDDNHLTLIEKPTDESGIEGFVENLHHQVKGDHSSPLWSLCILPLRTDHTHQKKFFAAFVFSHVLGDGMSGLAFHHSFLRSLQRKDSAPESNIIATGTAAFPAPFDIASRLPISWLFLLAPLLAVFMPKFLSNLLGLRAAASIIDSGTWLGPTIFFDASQTEQTRIKMITIESDTLRKNLQACRQNQAKLTGALHQVILHALKAKINQPGITNFASQTAVNMRGSICASDDEMGLFVSGYYENHWKENIAEIGSEKFWQAARHTSNELAKCAATLQDQPIGLLRFLPSIRSWTQGKLGQKRDGSYEVSNLGAFRRNQSDANSRANMSKIVFSQPANIPGAPLTFNFVSVQGGSLVCVVSWQVGALGLEKDKERSFVDEICVSIQRDLETLV